MSEQQEHPEGAVAAQDPVSEPASTQHVDPDQDAEQAPAIDPPVEAETPEAVPAPAPAAAAEDESRPEAAAEDDAPAPPQDEAPAPPQDDAPVGPKILGVAEEKALPVVKKRLQEKPKREPLPWPELRAAVAATRDELDVTELKELFRQFPEKLRNEVTENVRGFKKGARRPVSQHAAKQLARAAHTARRMKKNAHPSAEVAEALGQAMAAELIASLEPEKAAQVILPKRDLLERESRQAQRRARDEEDKRRDEQRRKRRDDARSSRQQTSFGGGFAGAKIQGLDEIAALFAEQPAAEEPEVAEPAAEAQIPVAAPEAPVTPATTAVDPEPQVEPEAPAEEAAGETPETRSAPQPQTEDGDTAA
ncbi:MAG TPA: hypothetical protein VI318_26165 [Baekduia sp.]